MTSQDLVNSLIMLTHNQKSVSFLHHKLIFFAHKNIIYLLQFYCLAILGAVIHIKPPKIVKTQIGESTAQEFIIVDHE